MTLAPGTSQLRAGTHWYDLPSGRVRATYKPSTSDRRTTVVIFSGFGAQGGRDFSGGSIAPIRNNVIWIHDEFGIPTKPSYYLYSSGTNTPQRCIEEFIQLMRLDLEIEPADIVALGFSKGASAALFFTAHLGLRAAIASAPQLAPASYCAENWPDVHDHMTDGSPEAHSAVDHAILDELTSKATSSQRYFILTSRADDQYSTQIEPHLDVLQALPGTSIITTSSPLVRRHSDVSGSSQFGV